MKTLKAKIIKHTFYPNPEVAKVLEGAPPKKLSERVNDLIIKGLTKEKEDAMRAEYERYDKEVAAYPSRKKDDRSLSNTMMMSARLFETDESDKDLF